MALKLVDLLELADSEAGCSVEALGGLGWASISSWCCSIYIHASHGGRKNGGCRFTPTSEKNKDMTTTGLCRPDCMEKEIVRPAQGQGNEGLRFGSLHEEPGSKCKGALNR